MKAIALTLTVLLCAPLLAQTKRLPYKLESVGLFMGRDHAGEAKAAQQKKAQHATGAAAAAQVHEARNEAASVGAEARVVAFLEQRIADGSIDARYDLGLRKLHGRGVQTNSVAGRQLMTEAANLGHSEASQWLAKNPAPTVEKP